MGTNADKRARQRERRSRLAEAEQTLERNRRRQRVLWIVSGVVVVAIVVGAVIALTGGSSTDGASETTGTERDTETEIGEPRDESLPVDGPAADLPEPPSGVTLEGDTPCPPAEGARERVQVFSGPPPHCLTPGASYSATFSTTEGDFTAQLAVDEAPLAVNNFVVLSRYRYYEGVPFHRIVPGFVIQAGDGDGAPWGSNELGYSFEDELPDGADAYSDYSLAMANAGPDTNGSQFFVVLPGGGELLQPLYSYFGQVVEGTDVVDAIGALGNAAQEPTRAVLINSITIHEDA